MGRNNQQRRRAKAKGRAAHPPPGRGSAFRAGPASGATTTPTDVERANDLVGEALRAAERGRGEAALARLVDFSSGTSRRRVVARTLSHLLRSRLSTLWQHGWQPADLLRLAGRSLDAAGIGVLRDAVVGELEQYAAGTVDPRWSAQLREAEATHWWSRDTDMLIARAASTGSWSAVCEATLRSVLFCAVLPALEVIGPRPGEAVPRTAATAEAAEVDERILSRVRQLLAKAESTTFDAEAETFTAGAQALMARHSIDAAMLAASGAPATGPGARRIGIERPYESPKAMLLNAVAEANRVRTVWSKELGFATILGFAPDLEAVETLFTSLLVQATQAVGREGTRRSGTGRSRTRSFRSSFLTSYAARIGERLREVTEAETEAATHGGGEHDDGVSAHPRTGPDNALVRVLAQRSGEVDEAVETMFPHLVTRSVSAPQDREGWRSGRSAADRATLDVRTRVPEGADSRVG